MTSQKTILITGASRGIGAATAIALAKTGAQIIGLARTTADLEAVDDIIQKNGPKNGGSMIIVPCDLTNLALIDQLPQQLASRFPALDGLILNADTATNLQPITSMDHKIWEKSFTITVHASMRLLRGLDPLLRAAPAAKVIALSNPVASQQTPFWALQSASKAALEALIKTYARETESTNITTHIHIPKRTNSACFTTAFPGKNPESESQTPEQAAAEITTFF